MDLFRSVSDFFAGPSQRDAFVGSRINLGGVLLDVESTIAEGQSSQLSIRSLLTRWLAGGFGIVYKCRDDKDVRYALKKMLAHDKAHIKPIRREIETIRRIWREGTTTMAQPVTQDLLNELRRAQ